MLRSASAALPLFSLPLLLLLLPTISLGFPVPLDQEGVANLRGRFAVLDIPLVRCPPVRRGRPQPWSPHCVHDLTLPAACAYNGFQYSMEWYFGTMLQDNSHYLAKNLEDADFVFFPQCVSQIYFSIRAEYNLDHWNAIARAELEYLVPLLRWAHGHPLHQRFQGRNFWTVFSMDLGRQDFPRSAAWLEHWSIGSLTGSESWMQDNNMMVLGADGRDGSEALQAATEDCWFNDTVAVAWPNELFPPRNFRRQDTVISIPSRFPPHEAIRIDSPHEDRPVLCFFAGSPNSCARRQILALFSHEPDFDVSTSFLDDEAYQKRLLESQYCLVLRGSSHTNNVRLYDNIAHGCIPVIVSDDFQPPLDEWLPWRDIAVFVPTSRISELGQILRHEISPARRQELYRNLAVGRSPSDDARAWELAEASLKRSGRQLDQATLWSGVSAAKVFHWHESAFWILFYADIAEKLTRHIQLGASEVLSDGSLWTARKLDSPRPSGPQLRPISRELSFRWRREDWWARERFVDLADTELARYRPLLWAAFAQLYGQVRRWQSTTSIGVDLSCSTGGVANAVAGDARSRPPADELTAAAAAAAAVEGPSSPCNSAEPRLAARAGSLAEAWRHVHLGSALVADNSTVLAAAGPGRAGRGGGGGGGGGAGAGGAGGGAGGGGGGGGGGAATEESAEEDEQYEEHRDTDGLLGPFGSGRGRWTLAGLVRSLLSGISGQVFLLRSPARCRFLKALRGLARPLAASLVKFAWIRGPLLSVKELPRPTFGFLCFCYSLRRSGSSSGSGSGSGGPRRGRSVLRLRPLFEPFLRHSSSSSSKSNSKSSKSKRGSDDHEDEEGDERDEEEDEDEDEDEGSSQGQGQGQGQGAGARRRAAFKTAQPEAPACAGDVVCGWDDDPDLDNLVHLVSNIDIETDSKASRQWSNQAPPFGSWSDEIGPARWGVAGSAYHEVEPPYPAPSTANRHGRFLYVADPN